MDTRKVILRLHLYLGLVSAIFLVILGLTGSIMAFEGQIAHWLHPSRWYVTPRPQTLPESKLFQLVEQRFAPDRVGSFTIAPESNIAQAIFIVPPRGKGPAGAGSPFEVTIDQYTGSILSVQRSPTQPHRPSASSTSFICALYREKQASLSSASSG